MIIDSPEFTHRVARRVRARAPEIPIVDYVCPSVWAWRPGRARAMRAYVDHVLALLPFEPAAMRELGGPACTYVGHPLSERAARLRPNAEEARRRLADPPVLLVLPGSRGSEIRRMAGVFGQAAALAAERVGKLEVVVPAVPRLAEAVQAAVAAWPVPARVVTDQDEKDAAFRIARAALAKSGTSTLELAVAGIPMVAAYKVPLFEEAVARLLLTVDTVILANLVLGENVVPELLQRDFTPKSWPQPSRPCWATAQSAGGKPRRLPASIRSCRSARPPPATGRLPWCSIAPVSGSNRRAKQWYPPRQQRNLPRSAQWAYAMAVNWNNRL